MTETDGDALKEKLDDFSRRLDDHVRDMKERGLFSESHQRLVADMTQRRDQINKKLASAEAKGCLWSVIRIETERDFGSLFDDLLQLNERLDADRMKSGAPIQDAGAGPGVALRH
jgi:hypothetical protein